DAADRAEGHAKIACLVLAVRDLRAPSIAAKAVADEGADEILGRDHPGRATEEECGERARRHQSSNRESAHRCHLMRAECKNQPDSTDVNYNSFSQCLLLSLWRERVSIWIR